jgi:oxygen-dependent protoporphyrinogen oxidase
MTVGIIGAGISGLTLAYELQRQGIPYQLWEASPQPGGYIQSRREQASASSGSSYLLESGPNSLLGDSALLEWIDELGLTAELLFSKPVSKARFIFREGQYRELPSGPPSLLFGRFFSWKTKLAIWRERSNKTLSPTGETLAQFFRRRFSQELVDYALGPFVAGIYAGDPEQLLVSETFPILLQYEKEYGSVVRGLIKNQSKTERRQSFSFQNGMQTLTDTLAARLTNLSLNTPVEQIAPVQAGWQVTVGGKTAVVDKLVIAIGAEATAQLVAPYNDDFANRLRAIAYPPMSVVHSVYKRSAVGHALNGFGGLNPKKEEQFSAGHIWSSSIFDGRCPADEVLFTTFVGGTQSAHNARQRDDVLLSTVHQELAKGFDIRADSRPVFQSIRRWERAIPQYDAAIAAVKEPVKAAEKDQLFVCANWYGGVSLSDCIQKAQKMGQQMKNNLIVTNF